MWHQKFGLWAVFSCICALGSVRLAGADVVFSDEFDYATTDAFVAEGGWSTWTGSGGGGAGVFWGNPDAAGNPVALEYEHPTPLVAGDTITMDAVLARPFTGYSYGMRIILWDGTDTASRVEVAGGTFNGPDLSQVSYVVTPADLTAGLTQVIFRYSHEGNWGETDSVSFAVDAAPAGWTWNNTAGGSWATAGNWDPAGPADGADQVASINLLDISGDQSITLDGSYTLGGLRFGDSAGADGNWILDPGSGGSLTLSAPTGGTPELTVNNQTATINAVLAGTEGLATSGAGNLVLGAANTYTGGTNISSGTVTIGDSAAIPSGPGAGDLTLDGTLDLADNSISLNGLSGNGTVTNSGTAAVTLSIGGDDADGLTFSGAINDGSGTTSLVKTGSGTQTLNGFHGLSGDIDVTGGALVLSRFNGLLNAGSITAGPGATVELGATNMFVAGHGTALDPARTLNSDGGTLYFNTDMNSRFGNVNLSNGATWTIDRATTAFDALLGNVSDGPATVTVANSGGNTSASTLNGIGGLHLQGLQDFDIADVTGDANDDFIVEIPLVGPGSTGGAAGGITKLGAGTMRLRGFNTYSGNTVVAAGTLVLEEFSGLSFVIGANGVNNRISGDGTVILDGDFDIDLTNADTTTGNSWTLVEAADRSFGPGFFIPGFIEVDDVHTFDDGNAVWTFTEATGTLTVESGLNYADWAATNAGGEAADGDFDGDGTPNGIEFFMGETGSSFTARPTPVDGTITWPRNPEANLSYVVETSTTLQDELTPGDGGWTPAGAGVVDDGSSVSFTPADSGERLFVRLRVTIP